MNITVETCELNQRATSNSGGWQSLTAPQGKYSFINKIIDGITVTVNTVNVHFKSTVFTASVQVGLHLLLSAVWSSLTLESVADVSHPSGVKNSQMAERRSSADPLEGHRPRPFADIQGIVVANGAH